MPTNSPLKAPQDSANICANTIKYTFMAVPWSVWVPLSTPFWYRDTHGFPVIGVRRLKGLGLRRPPRSVEGFSPIPVGRRKEGENSPERLVCGVDMVLIGKALQNRMRVPAVRRGFLAKRRQNKV